MHFARPRWIQRAVMTTTFILALAASLYAQSEHQHQHQQEPPHDMSKMGGEHAAHPTDTMMATITGGPFKAMTAIGSGTSLLPSSTPGFMWHLSIIIARGAMATGHRA